MQNLLFSSFLIFFCVGESDWVGMAVAGREKAATWAGKDLSDYASQRLPLEAAGTIE